MARKGELLGVSGSETLIGTGVIVKGNLSTEGDVVIDGSLIGEIKSSGSVSLGVNADIKANIIARNVIISGNLKGNVTAESEAVITDTGRVEGDITTYSLVIASGGIFSGQSRMSLPTIVSPEPQTEENIAD